ncbi:hypothetical protein D9O29_01525 [Pantoea vagans]|uniref:Uncharacterized protein n=1 Tax=Pantoea vagans TaxID=470934 RepID=A0ABY3LJX2_9GAMM|nr:hypothetical protein D9O29_01525 [Pantoea vagans]
MAAFKKFIENWGNLIIHLLSVILCAASFSLTLKLNSSQIQPIASAISTFSGILFGFVMASITLIASAKSNTLVQNTQRTGYLTKMLGRMHATMGWLLLVCIIFILILFMPDSLKMKNFFSDEPKQILYSQITLTVGLYTVLVSFKNFIYTWFEFKSFTKNM